ncbi:hypothetical protein [Candidatus Pelagibacter communis]|uniref:hypothetical protein n=1 Tax=Pelagibacter ubique TaxID=198252 RepID=UPI00094DC73C|nr:hypothetical protein [Candidatus Pelagibacter ubique]
MATIKQINANRKNALLSKGPKTDLGKLNSSKNSLKHGLTAKQLVIGEDLNEFEKYRDHMIEALKPEGILEEQIVYKIIDVGFRLRRIGGIEAGIYNQEILHHELDEYKQKMAEKIEFKDQELVQSSDRSINLKGLAFARDCKYGSAILKLNTIEDKLMNKYYRQLEILKMMQEGRHDLEK